MAVVKFVKSIYDGTDVTALGEIASGDTVAIPAGSSIEGVTPTGATGTGKVAFGNGPTFVGTKETKVVMAANDVDLSAGNYFTKTISGATTLTVSNVPATGTAASFILDLTNGGSATITWPTGSKFAGGTAPTLTASGRDVLGCFIHDGGTTLNWLLLAKDVK